jgi:NAD-specific glutamate dehydrogenase
VVADMLAAVSGLVDDVVTRLLAAGPAVAAAPSATVARDRAAFERLAERLDDLGSAARLAARARRAEQLVDAGVAPALAARVAGLADLGVALDAAAVAVEIGADAAEVAHALLGLREDLGLDAVAVLLERVPSGDHWTRAALAGAAADLRELAATAVRRTLGGTPPDVASVSRARELIRQVEASTPTVASVSVALRAVRTALG